MGIWTDNAAHSAAYQSRGFYSICSAGDPGDAKKMGMGSTVRTAQQPNPVLPDVFFAMYV